MKFHWRIRHKLAAGLVLVVGMTGLLSAGAFYGLYSYKRSSKTFNYYQNQLELLGVVDYTVSELCIMDLTNVEGASRPTDSTVARRGKIEKVDRIEAKLEKYRVGLSESADGAFSREGVDKQLFHLAEMSELLTKLRVAVSGGQPSVAANTASSMGPWWVTKNERDIIANLILSLGRLRGLIHTEINWHVTEVDPSNYRASLAIVYSTSVLVLLLLVALVWLGYRAVFHPIRELYLGVTKLADIDFDSRVRLDTGDEMQELGEAFNTMADRLKGVYQDLNHKVEERSRQLIRSERLASVGFLAAGVAHEINNPLASIAFCAEALEGRLQPTLLDPRVDAEVVKNYLDMIQQEAFRCKSITEKLLDFSRVGEPERVETDIIGLVRNVMEMVQHLGRTKNKNLVFEPQDMLIARVNPHELKQVLLNLVVNALESVNDGGTVTIDACVENGQVRLAVVDDGCGMTEEVLQNLFEPFFTRNRTGKGTGLGLSISHLIISQHGGTLDAFSAGPGKGSTFTIRLPDQAALKMAA